ncbi:hypothetical protein ACWEQ3_42765 [Streptomyces mirabilis]
MVDDRAATAAGALVADFDTPSYVLPAQAGVSRTLLRCGTVRSCPPRAGGGEPDIHGNALKLTRSSPRGRG